MKLSIRDKLLLCTFATFSLAVQAQTAIIPTIGCNSTPKAFNTGVNDDGSKITAGSNDLQWWFTSVQQDNTANNPPPANATWAPAFVPTSPPPYAYPAQANWISPQANGTTRTRPPATYPYSPAITNYYRTQFYLAPDVPPSAVSFTVNYVVDDFPHGAFVNGTAVPETSSGKITLNGPWQTGLNTIVIPVDDYGWASGLVVDAEPPKAFSVCKPSTSQPIPAMDNWALFALSGLLVLCTAGVARRSARKR